MPVFLKCTLDNNATRSERRSRSIWATAPHGGIMPHNYATVLGFDSRFLASCSAACWHRVHLLYELKKQLTKLNYLPTCDYRRCWVCWWWWWRHACWWPVVMGTRSLAAVRDKESVRLDTRRLTREFVVPRQWRTRYWSIYSVRTWQLSNSTSNNRHRQRCRSLLAVLISIPYLHRPCRNSRHLADCLAGVVP